MRVTIIGSGGFLGRVLHRRLAERGDEVQAVSSSSSTTPPGIDPITGTVDDSFAIHPGTNAVVYLAQSPHYRQVPEKADHLLKVNLVSAVRVAQQAAAAGVKRFLYLSTGSVYAPSFMPLDERAVTRRDRWYPLSKLLAEEALSLFRPQLEVVCVRPFGIYGPGQTGMLTPNLLRSLTTGQAISLDGNPQDALDRDGLKISLSYVDDAAQAIERLLEHPAPPAVMNLAGRAVSIRSLAETLGQLSGIAPRFQFTDRVREADLIADTALMERTVGRVTTDLATGLSHTLAASGHLAAALAAA